MSNVKNAIFVVQRGDDQYKILGSDIVTKIQPEDILVIERELDHYKLTIEPLNRLTDNFDVLEADDLLVCEKDNVNYKVLGINFIEQINDGLDLRVIFPPKINLDEVQQIADVEENSFAVGGTKPYTYTNYWTKINFFEALISNNLTQNLTPLTVLTSGDVFQIGYCQTAISNGTQLRCTYSPNGSDWSNSNITQNVICKGARFFNGEFWMAMADAGNSRNVLRSSDGLNWRTIPVNPAGTSTGGKLFNIDFNPSTGTVIVVGHNVIARTNIDDIDAFERGEITAQNLWQGIYVPVDHDNQSQKNYWGYLRACCCDPNTNEWWLGQNKGIIHYSSDDGATWYKTNGVIPSGNSQSYYMEVDNNNLYYTDAENKKSAVLNRNTYEIVTSEYYSYRRVDNLDMYRVRKGGLVEAKNFYGKNWSPIFAEPINFSNDGPIIFDARNAESDWIFVMKKEVVVRESSLTVSINGEINQDSIDATNCTSITLKQVVSDSDNNTAEGLANIEV